MSYQEDVVRGRKRQRKKNLKKHGLWLDKAQRRNFIDALVRTSVLHPESHLVPMRRPAP